MGGAGIGWEGEYRGVKLEGWGVVVSAQLSTSRAMTSSYLLLTTNYSRTPRRTTHYAGQVEVRRVMRRGESEGAEGGEERRARPDVDLAVYGDRDRDPVRDPTLPGSERAGSERAGSERAGCGGAGSRGSNAARLGLVRAPVEL